MLWFQSCCSLRAKTVYTVALLLCGYAFALAGDFAAAQDLPPKVPPQDKAKPDAPKPESDVPPVLADGGAFVVLYTGERGARLGTMTEPLKALGDFVGPKVLGAGKRYCGHASDTASGLDKLMTAHKPQWGIVSAAYYLGHKQSTKMTPLFEARRGEAAFIQYSLVVGDASLTIEKLDGKKVVTTLTDESEYLNKVVLEQKVKPVWTQVNDTSDSLFSILEKKPDAPVAVLIDQVAAAALAKDETLQASLKVIWTSEELCPRLAVRFDDHCPQATAPLLEAQLHLLASDKDGKPVLEQIGISAWGEVNKSRLETEAQLLVAAEKKKPETTPAPVPAKDPKPAKDNTGSKRPVPPGAR